MGNYAAIDRILKRVLHIPSSKLRKLRLISIEPISSFTLFWISDYLRSKRKENRQKFDLQVVWTEPNRAPDGKTPLFDG